MTAIQYMIFELNWKKQNKQKKNKKQWQKNPTNFLLEKTQSRKLADYFQFIL